MPKTETLLPSTSGGQSFAPAKTAYRTSCAQGAGGEGKPAKSPIKSQLLIVLSLTTLPLAANAHGFGRLYTLPVPLWLYAAAATATLLISFALIGWFATQPTNTKQAPERDISQSLLARTLFRLAPTLKLLSVLILTLVITTALFGNRDPYRNFSMIAFWIVFVLGLTYLTAVVGNIYEVLNPWRVLANGIGRFWPSYRRGLLPWPAWLSLWPALFLYLGFIGYELFSTGKPQPLGWLLLGYTAFNLIMAGLFGINAWFERGEFFSVFLRFIGHMSVIRIQPSNRASQGEIFLRAPFSGLRSEKPTSLVAVVFILAMLATTAFDGLTATQWWVRLFWADPFGYVQTLIGSHPMRAIEEALPWYMAWEFISLLAAPFLYFLVYMLTIWLAKLITRSRHSARQLALEFSFSLIPIALVYHISHYATLLLSDGLKILSVISDPFGQGWNLFGTAWKYRAPILPDMSIVWHSQVGIILFGHVVGVYIAHRIALDVFGSRRKALLSQLPLLMLMIAITVIGLWILSQPLTVERMN